jgi:hypothetical protein
MKIADREPRRVRIDRQQVAGRHTEPELEQRDGKAELDRQHAGEQHERGEDGGDSEGIHVSLQDLRRNGRRC